MIKHTFQAGIYYVGDPCYAIGNEQWDKLIKETGCFGLENEATNWQNGLFFYNGFKCFAGGTAFGDGVYRCGLRRFAVDAGLLSIMPVIAVDQIPVEGKNGYFDYVSYQEAVNRNLRTTSCAIEIYHKKFEVWVTAKGHFHFGKIQIDTR